MHKRPLIIMVLVLACSGPFAGAETSSIPIGLVLAVEGNVYSGHPGDAKPRLVRVQDRVFAGDSVETQYHSRVQILLDDDALITMAGNSRLALPASVSNGAGKPRRAVFALERGRARVLIGRPIVETRTFELHGGGAKVSTDSAYFAMWVQEPLQSFAGDMLSASAPTVSAGVANIGISGAVVFEFAEQPLAVPPGSFTAADTSSTPFQVHSITEHPGVQRLLTGTEMKQPLKRESPRDLLQAMEPPLSTVITAAGQTDAAAVAAGLDTATQGAPYSPPAVISGVMQSTPSGANSPPANPTPSASSVSPAGPPAIQAPPPAPTPTFPTITDVLETATGGKGKRR